ncbi:hypothetical protein RA307_31300 [Xanthobacteraceae bacterium Astr-EGSB]|uniref:hypothetical protein n=1 Tax=Astrobacterium formosum TaxID=3069710 RepID=UPI0027AED518|nr:hypothetical protein [Xanthobacteraceae bacterium Astr-EGSB]
MMELRIVVWFLGGGWRWIAGAAVVVAIAGLFYATWYAGYEDAAAKCDAAAKQAQIDKLRLEIKTANAVAEGAQETAETLRSKAKEAQQRRQQLDDEIKTLRERLSQAPKPGRKAKNALVDGRCDLTSRGVRFFTRP